MHKYNKSSPKVEKTITMYPQKNEKWKNIEVQS